MQHLFCKSVVLKTTSKQHLVLNAPRVLKKCRGRNNISFGNKSFEMHGLGVGSLPSGQGQNFHKMRCGLRDASRLRPSTRVSFWGFGEDLNVKTGVAICNDTLAESNRGR